MTGDLANTSSAQPSGLCKNKSRCSVNLPRQHEIIWMEICWVGWPDIVNIDRGGWSLYTASMNSTGITANLYSSSSSTYRLFTWLITSWTAAFRHQGAGNNAWVTFSRYLLWLFTFSYLCEAAFFLGLNAIHSLGWEFFNETPSPFLNIIDLYKFDIITIIINDMVSASKPSFIAAKSFLDLLRISRDGMLEREAWNGARTTVTLNVAFIWGSSNPGNIIRPRMSSSWVATMYLRWLSFNAFNYRVNFDI